MVTVGEPRRGLEHLADDGLERVIFFAEDEIAEVAATRGDGGVELCAASEAELKRELTRSETIPLDTVVPTEGLRSRRMMSPSISATALSPMPKV